jgi:2-iminobutanoate/2-iminopropanoate deaminase
MKRAIQTEKAPSAIGPYNQAIETGNMVFTSGQIPLNQNGEIIQAPLKELAITVLQNIENILKETDLDKNNIIKITIFLTDLSAFGEVNQACKDFFEGCVYPARSTVEVSALPKGSPIEIEAIAIK